MVPKLTKLQAASWKWMSASSAVKKRNKHEHKKLKAGRGAVGKTAVLGMRERGRVAPLPLRWQSVACRKRTKRIHEQHRTWHPALYG